MSPPKSTSFAESAMKKTPPPFDVVIRNSPVQKRIEFPLIHSSAPGRVPLKNERIAEILEQEDNPPRSEL